MTQLTDASMRHSASIGSLSLYGSSWQERGSVGLENGMALHGGQAIFWTNDNHLFRRIHVYYKEHQTLRWLTFHQIHVIPQNVEKV